MKIFFSSKTKLIKTADDKKTLCRLCGNKKLGINVNSLPVVPYSLLGESTANKNRKKLEEGCTTCNNTGKITTGSPVYTECPTCTKGAKTLRGIGLGEGLYLPEKCEKCRGTGTVSSQDYEGGEGGVQFIKCKDCGGSGKGEKPKVCPTCEHSDKPGFTQTGESEHNIFCPACGGSKKHPVAEPYTPIFQVKCPHLDGADTFTRPNNTDDDIIGPHDYNYFEGIHHLDGPEKDGHHVLPLRLLWKIRGFGETYNHTTEGEEKSLTDFDGETPQQVGRLTPPLPQIKSDKEPSYMDLFSRTNLLVPDNYKISNNNYAYTIKKFNSKTATSNEPEDQSQSSDATSSNIDEDDFFGKKETPPTSTVKDIDFEDFIPPGAFLPSPQKTLTPEQRKRLEGGPVTVRQMDESDMLRPYLRNPSKAIERTKSMLKGQKTLSDKRDTMLKMFRGMKALGTKTTIKSTDSDEQKSRKQKKRYGGLRPSYRNWRDNLNDVSVNLDYFNQIRSSLRKQLSGVLGKRMDPDVATALTHKVFREGRSIKINSSENGGEGETVDLSNHRLGITDPMPYFKNDESWRETHHGFGCDHEPSGKHEPDVGCIIDYHNPAENPREGITTGFNSRLVTGKYTTEQGKTILQTVGARTKRVAETGSSKQTLRTLVPQWTPENHGRIVELSADRATCVPNRIQREHYVVDHTIDPPTERTQYVDLPQSKTGIPEDLRPEPVLNKEKIQFPQEIRTGGPDPVYVGNPLYQLSNPFSSQEVERGMWANNPAVKHLAEQIKGDKRPTKFKPYVPEPKFNSQTMRTRPGLTGPDESPGNNDMANLSFDAINSLFNNENEAGEGSSPKTSRKEDKAINPVEENADDTYDINKKLKLQKMQRVQVHMVEPTNPSDPDITPHVPTINYN